MSDVPRKRGIPMPAPRQREDGGRDMPLNRPGGVEAARARRGGLPGAKSGLPDFKTVKKDDEPREPLKVVDPAEKKREGFSVVKEDKENLSPIKVVKDEPDEPFVVQKDEPEEEKVSQEPAPEELPTPVIVEEQPEDSASLTVVEDKSRAKKPPLKIMHPSQVEEDELPFSEGNRTYDAWQDDDVKDIEVPEDDDEEPEPKNFKREKTASQFTSTRAHRLKLTERDLLMLDFLARYRYGIREQLCILTDSSDAAVKVRLLKLGHAGFVRKENVFNGRGVWTPTNLGMQVVDQDFKVLNAGQISMVTMSHTLGLGNLGVEIESGNAAELMGMHIEGTRVITEREVRSSADRIKNSREAYKEDNNWAVNEDEGIIFEDPDYNPDGRSPELVPGNEGLFVISDEMDHIPDMVIPLMRDADGFPRSIGIELELSPKSHNAWKRILTSYRESMIFGKVVYFTHRRNIAASLKSIAKRLGLNEEQFDVRKYTPRSKELIWG